MILWSRVGFYGVAACFHDTLEIICYLLKQQTLRGQKNIADALKVQTYWARALWAIYASHLPMAFSNLCRSWSKNSKNPDTDNPEKGHNETLDHLIRQTMLINSTEWMGTFQKQCEVRPLTTIVSGRAAGITVPAKCPYCCRVILVFDYVITDGMGAAVGSTEGRILQRTNRNIIRI